MNKFIAPCVGVLLFGLLSAAAVAQAPSESMSALPPPGINDPGVTTTANNNGTKLPVMSGAQTQPLTSGLVAHTEAPPEVNIRRQDGDIVQEYSYGGRIYMIKVIPENGPVQTYRDTDSDGLLNPPSERAAVAPVYYTLYEWGQPQPLPDENN